MRKYFNANAKVKVKVKVKVKEQQGIWYKTYAYLPRLIRTGDDKWCIVWLEEIEHRFGFTRVFFGDVKAYTYRLLESSWIEEEDDDEEEIYSLSYRQARRSTHQSVL